MLSVVEIRTGTLEEAVLRLILQKYPITNREIAKTLGARLESVNIILIQLEKRRVIKLEPLPDVWYIRIATTDIQFVGRNPTQRHALKHKKNKKKKLMKRRDTYEGIMYQ